MQVSYQVRITDLLGRERKWWYQLDIILPCRVSMWVIFWLYAVIVKKCLDHNLCAKVYYKWKDTGVIIPSLINETQIGGRNLESCTQLYHNFVLGWSECIIWGGIVTF